MIKAVIFDLDDTLYSWKGVHDAAFARAADYAARELGADPEELRAEYKKTSREMTDALGKSAAIHNRLIRFLRFLQDRNLPLYHARILEGLYWNGVMDLAVPEKGAADALQALADAGYILGIGTNMTLDWQLQKLERLGMLQYFRFVVSSEEAGAEKPDRRLFELCVKNAGVPAEECLFVGDSLKGDVLGAENAGLHALWYAPGETDFSIHPGFSDFAELKHLVDAMI